MNVTFETVILEKSWGSNIYNLDVLIDGKRTGILIEAGSGGGFVDGSITLFYGDILDVHMDGTIKVVPPNETSRIFSVPYEIKIKGTISHLKKYVVENIKEILDIVHPFVQSLKNEISESSDTIHQFLESEGEDE